MLDTPGGLFDAADVKLEAPQRCGPGRGLLADHCVFTPEQSGAMWPEKGGEAAALTAVVEGDTSEEAARHPRRSIGGDVYARSWRGVLQ